MAAKGERIGDDVLARMAGHSVRDEIHANLPSGVQSEVSLENMAVVAGAAFEIALYEASKWPVGDPRLVTMREFTTRLAAAVARPEGEV